MSVSSGTRTVRKIVAGETEFRRQDDRERPPPSLAVLARGQSRHLIHHASFRRFCLHFRQ